MLWILLGILLVVLIISLICSDEATSIWSCILLIIDVIVLIICLVDYNFIKATADKRIAVLEQRNNEVITQIEPLVKQYLEYESNTFKELKPNADRIIAIAQYPNLKGNEFIQTQVKVILENQEKITDLKLEKAGLNSYKLWLFMGE